MTVPAHFITDEAKFNELRSHVDTILFPGVELPQVPFRESFTPCGFEEFDWTMCDAFWPLLQKLASQSSDHEIIFGVLEPDPVQYFKAHFGYYNWGILPTTLSKDEYWKFLDTGPVENSADSMWANARTLVFTVPSKRWVIWGERGAELCALAYNSNEPQHTWRNLEWVVNLFPFEKWAVFTREIVENFKPRLDPDIPRHVQLR